MQRTVLVNGWCELINPLSGKFVGKALLMVAIGLRHQIKAITLLEDAAKDIQFHWKWSHRQSDYRSENDGSPLQHVQDHASKTKESQISRQRRNNKENSG